MTDLLSDLPECLKTRRAWVCWRYETRDGKPTKVPISPATGKRAKSNDPSTWTDFPTVCKHAGRFAGLGIMFDDGLCGVDLDDCRDPQTGSVEPWAEEIIRGLDSYTEASPSGTGVHVLLFANLPPGGRRKGDVEIYGPGSPRYFTITGQHLNGTPATVEPRQEQLDSLHRRIFGERQTDADRLTSRPTVPVDLSDRELLAKARAAKNGAEFSRLWDGGYPDDDSKGDFDLCLCLAFWTGGNAARMDALFRQSGRMRPKWDDPRGDETWGQRTIRKALEQTTDFYSPGRKKNAKKAPMAGGDDMPERDQGAVTPSQLAAAILKNEAFAVDDGLSLYAFDRGCYRPKGDRRIKVCVKHLMQERGQSEKWSSYKQQEVVEYVRVDAPALLPIPPLEIINCANGLLDLTTRDLRPHRPDFLSPVQLPVAYDPKATCPGWLRFVEETFPEDTLELPWELFAWLMRPNTSIQKAVLLLGEGANGKSTFLAALTAFLGTQNCANVSLHKLEADRFAAAQLVGKLANVCPDLPSAHLAGTSMFKAITGGDLIHAERKYAEGFAFNCYARLVFSANHPPQSADSSHAFFRRWLCVPFTRTFEGKEARPRGELDAELADARELSGVLNLALAALPGVTQHGVTETDSMQEAWGEFRTATDPLAVWLDRETISDPTAVTPKEHLCRAYNAFCERTGRPIVVPQQFGRAVRRLCPGLQETQRTIAGNKVRVWLGIGLRGDPRQNEENG